LAFFLSPPTELQQPTADPTRPRDGKWVEAVTLKADDGWREIQARLDKLNPGDAPKYKEVEHGRRASGVALLAF
jgi:hypothetical protein